LTPKKGEEKAYSIRRHPRSRSGAALSHSAAERQVRLVPPDLCIRGRGSGVELFNRLVSRRHFEKVKPIFNVKAVDELKALIEECVARNNADQRNYSSSLWDYDIRPLENVLNVQKIATTG
jgi:hypothetical protein